MGYGDDGPSWSKFTIFDLSLEEGDSDSLVIKREGGYENSILLQIKATKITANPEDYSIKYSEVRFKSDEDSKKIPIEAIDDNFREVDETLTITISSTDPNAKFTRSTATLTITDDDYYADIWQFETKIYAHNFWSQIAICLHNNHHRLWLT